MAAGLAQIQDLPLENLPIKGDPPMSRLKDVAAAEEIYTSLRRADEANAVNRARVQAMFDGTPPYNEAALEQSGQGFRTNLNFGEAEAFLETAMSAYVDLVNSVETLASVETEFGEDKQRHEYGKIISEEISRMVRSWPDFNFEFLNLCHHFVTHGVGINYFEDEVSWKWKSTGLGDVLIPRGTQASESRIDVAAIKRDMTVTQLYNFIENEDQAKELGWNVEEVRKAITTACDGLDASHHGNWEKLQEELKNNDLYAGGKAAKIKVVHLFVQEFNGTVSHFITLHNGENKEFLLKSMERYGSVSQAFTFFAYGLGTNATYHGIRGLGYKIYPHIQVSNRLRSQVVDAAMLGSSVMIQPEDERALDNFSFDYVGPLAMISPQMKFLERSVPNLSNSVMPVLGDLSEQVHNRAGQYSTSSVFSGSQDKTRFEIAAHLEQASKLSVTSLNLFYEPWDRHLKEVVRRFIDAAMGQSSDPIVQDTVGRIMARGVPYEALAYVDIKRTKAARAVGGGSAAKRTLSLQQLNEMAGVFDEEGRHNLFRDQAAALVGYDQVDRYMPARPGARIAEVGKIAMLENTDMSQGTVVPVFPNESHITHLEMHAPFIEEVFSKVETGELLIEEATPQVLYVFQHAVQHLEQVQQDPTIKDKVAEFNQRLQRLSELIINGQKRIEAIQREQAQAAPEGEQAPNQPDPQMIAKLQEHRVKLQMMQEKHQAEMMIRLQKAEQERQLVEAKKGLELQSLLRR